MLLAGFSISYLIVSLVTLVIALTVHEFSHAWMANAFGDDTARRAGRLTLNPLAHLDPVGSLMLLIAGFGWAKPTPIDPFILRRRSPAALVLVSLAGAFSNFLLAAIAALPLRFGLVPYTPASSGVLPTASQFLTGFVVINLTLAIFNLIPIAPLDGEKALSELFPDSLGRVMDQLRPYGPLVLMLLIFAAPLLGFNVLSAVINPILNGLFGVLVG
jgi:Zn-dependent protease